MGAVCVWSSRTTVVSQTDKAVVNGAHDAAQLQTLMNGFINKFVLCPKCSLPETDLVPSCDALIGWRRKRWRETSWSRCRL